MILADKYIVKYITVLHGLRYRRASGVIFVAYSELKHPDELNKVFDDEVEFVREIIPVLRDYLPKL